jgi:hypothetical protein
MLSYSAHEGPGRGSTHVPFGHKVAGFVKSPTASVATNLRKVNEPNYRQMPGGKAYSKSEEMRDACLQRRKREIERWAAVPQHIVDDQLKAVPGVSLIDPLPKHSLVRQRDRCVEVGRVGKERGQSASHGSVSTKLRTSQKRLRLGTRAHDSPQLPSARCYQSQTRRLRSETFRAETLVIRQISWWGRPSLGSKPWPGCSDAVGTAVPARVPVPR